MGLWIFDHREIVRSLRSPRFFCCPGFFFVPAAQATLVFKLLLPYRTYTFFGGLPICHGQASTSAQAPSRGRVVIPV